MVNPKNIMTPARNDGGDINNKMTKRIKDTSTCDLDGEQKAGHTGSRHQDLQLHNQQCMYAYVVRSTVQLHAIVHLLSNNPVCLSTKPTISLRPLKIRLRFPLWPSLTLTASHCPRCGAKPHSVRDRPHDKLAFWVRHERLNE